MSPNLLEVRDLRKWYDIRRGVIPKAVGAVRAIDGVSFSVSPGEVLGVGGESGSGKTTIGRSVLRLVEPSDGSVLFRGRDVRRMNRRELKRFRRDAQIIFQDPRASLNPKMRIEQILSEPLIVQGQRLSRTQRRARVAEMLELVSLSANCMNRLPKEFSGGERQRIAIARALMLEPSFVVADEPTSALDVLIQAQIISLLSDLKQRLNLSMLFISHDLAAMEYLSDRIAVVYLGRVMEIGPTAEICNRPKHPYTKALLSAVPAHDPSHRRQRVILTGDVPNPANPPSGCVFRTRCPFAIADCATIVPEPRSIAPDHTISCIRDDLVGPANDSEAPVPPKVQRIHDSV